MMAAGHPVRAYSCSAVCACNVTESVVSERMDAVPRGWSGKASQTTVTTDRDQIDREVGIHFHFDKNTHSATVLQFFHRPSLPPRRPDPAVEGTTIHTVVGVPRYARHRRCTMLGAVRPLHAREKSRSDGTSGAVPPGKEASYVNV
jgi:hypothetical protein